MSNATLRLVQPQAAPDFRELAEAQHAQASKQPAKKKKITNLAEAYEHIRRPRFDLRKNGMGFEFFTQAEIDMIAMIATRPEFSQELFTANALHQKLGYSSSTVRKALRRLCDSMIIFETLNPGTERGVYCYGAFKGRPQEINSYLARTMSHGGDTASQTVIWLVSLSLHLDQPLMSRDAPDVFAGRRSTINEHCHNQSGLLEAFVAPGLPGFEYRPTKMGISVAKHWQAITDLVAAWKE